MVLVLDVVELRSGKSLTFGRVQNSKDTVMPMLRVVPSLPILVVASLLVGSVAAVEVPLPELAGDYDTTNYIRTVTVDVGGSLVGISGAELYMAGSMTPGVVGYYDEFDELQTEPWPAEFGGGFYEMGTSAWFAWTGGHDGAFEVTVPFQGIGDPNWDFLADGVAEFTFEFIPASLVGLVFPITDPYGSITEVTLIIHATVPVEESTWGRVKALYR
jgi:hypothetical protein